MANVDFKKEEEVQEYLERIGIEYRFGCYSEKRPEVCHLLGMYLEVIKDNVEKATQIFKVNCDTYKWPFSCYKYAYNKDWESKEENKDEVYEYYKRGCEAGLPRSCYLAGVKLGAKAEESKAPFEERKKMFEQALDYMDKACTDREGIACYNLSSIYLRGIPEVKIPKCLDKIFEYSKKGCEHRHMTSCVNLSVMYTKGEGVKRDLNLAKKYKEEADEIYKEMTEKGIEFEQGID